MILSLELTLLFYLALAGIFRLLWPLSPVVALSLLIGFNFLFLAMLNLALVSYVLVQILLIVVLYHLCVWRSNKNYAWLAFLGLIPFNIKVWFGDSFGATPYFNELGFGPEARVAFTVGGAFLVIKSFVCLREALKANSFPVTPTLAGLTFVPSYTAGPIFGTKPFNPENIVPKISVKAATLAGLDLGWGIAALYGISPRLKEFADNSENIIVSAYLGLGALYFDFSGYSLIAISFAAFFGVTLPQNFNRPYLAVSIRDFWRRWHMSLGQFVNTYLFKPFVRFTGSAQRGIFVAFVFVGLWHEFTLGYFLWGLGHGAALSLAMKPPKFWSSLLNRLPVLVQNAIGWFLTMSWVATLSYSANVMWF